MEVTPAVQIDTTTESTLEVRPQKKQRRPRQPRTRDITPPARSIDTTTESTPEIRPQKKQKRGPQGSAQQSCVLCHSRRVKVGIPPYTAGTPLPLLAGGLQDQCIWKSSQKCENCISRNIDCEPPPPKAAKTGRCLPAVSKDITTDAIDDSEHSAAGLSSQRGAMPTIPNPQVAQADPLPPDAQTDLGLRLAGPSLPAGSKETAIDTIDDGGSLQPAAIIQPRGNACDTFTPSKADNPPNRGSDKPPQINPPQLNRFQTNHFHISPFNNSPFNNPFHINSFQTGPDLVFPFYPNSGPFYSSPFYHPTCLTNPLNPYLGPNLFDFGPLGPNLLPGACHPTWAFGTSPQFPLAPGGGVGPTLSITDVTATTDTAKDPTATGCEDS